MKQVSLPLVCSFEDKAEVPMCYRCVHWLQGKLIARVTLNTYVCLIEQEIFVIRKTM